MRRTLLISVLLFLGLAGGGCDDWPKDPDGTLDRVRGGTMRVGISASPPWTQYEHGQPSGIEAALVERLASELDATVEWRHAGETTLLQALEQAELDLVVGGLVQSSPWSSRVGFARPYFTREQGDRKQAHVWAVPKGENGWIVEIERFLHRQKGAMRQLLREADEAGAP